MTDSYREVAVGAATSAGALLRDHFGGRRHISYKLAPTNLVTEMDRRAEALILQMIRARCPDHAVLAEESGASGAASHRWIVDPLDGTTNYAHGVPLFGVSVALEVEGQLVLGVVYDPVREECFVAERGRGATLNGHPIRVSATAGLNESLLATGYPYDIREAADNNLAEHAALSLRCRCVRELGSAVLSLAWLATGRMDGYWELRLGAWDVAAGALLVEEAGGTVTDVAGGPLDLSRPSVLATNGLIHRDMLDALKEVRIR
jgi:myo-inositol-1(or 4)-monophosphatase